MAQPRPRQQRTRRLSVAIGIALLLTAPLGTAAADRPGTPPGAMAGPAEAAGDTPSASFLQAAAHANDPIDAEPGGRVSVPFVPRGDDAWDVDGGTARGLPAGLATGSQLRDAPPSRAWATTIPDDVAAPWHFLGARAAAEATSFGDADAEDPANGIALTSASVAPRVDAPEAAPVGSNGLRREVFGFLPYWELGDRDTVLDWRTISTLAYFSVGCTSNGGLWTRNADGSTSAGWAGWTSSKMTSIIDAAHAHQTRVVLTVSCFAWTASGRATQAAILGSATARARLARQVAAAVRERGADGVNLDFEPIAAGYGAEFTKLVRSIRAELRAIAPGYQLTFDALGAMGNQPIAEATAPGGADAVLVMAYDYRTAGADVAGSIAPLSGPEYDLGDTIRAFTAKVPPSKLILGVAWYGRAWSTPSDEPHARSISGGKYGTVAEPTYAQAFDLLGAFGRRWDPVEQSPWTAYRRQTCTPAAGCVTSWRELYIDDAASLALRYDLVNRAGLRGVGIWALGFDGAHPELRAGLADKFLTDRTPPVAGIVTLAPRQRDEGFRVAWTAYDDSPIRGYDVQVAIDGGPWSSWLVGTTLSSAIYLGTSGRTYAFRVRASDIHGNTSAWRSLPRTSLGAPATITRGGFASVVTEGLRLRAAPTTSAGVMTTFRAGDALQVIGGPLRVQGYTWYEVAGPVRQWGAVDGLQVGGWVAASGNGVTNVVPRSAVYATRIDAGITGLRINGGRHRILTPNGDATDDALHLTWTNHRTFDSLALRVFSSNGTLVGVRTIGPAGRSAGAHALDWDGRLSGVSLRAGTYVLQLQGTSGATIFSAASASPVSGPQLARWGFAVGAAAPAAVVSFRSTTGSVTGASAITYAVTFGGPVKYLERDDIGVAGTARGCRVGVPVGGGATWTFTVSGCGQGTLAASVRAGAVMDAVSNWGPDRRSTAPTVVIDRMRPSTTAPKTTLRTGVPLASIAPETGLLATLTWSSADVGGAGIASVDVRRSRDGGPFLDLVMGVAGSSLAVSLAPDHAYRFEIRARDRAGNVGPWVAGSTFSAQLLQQASPSLSFRGSWSVGASSHYSATFDRFSTDPGASVAMTFTGRGIGFVTTRGPDRGAVRVYVDGSPVATTDTYAAQPGFRSVAWSRTWTTVGIHSVRLVVVGTPGRPRVDVDAFEILR